MLFGGVEIRMTVDTAGAMALLSCTKWKLEELRQTGYLKPLWRGVYAVKDIEACVEKLRLERDANEDKVIDIHEAISKKERNVGGQKGRPQYRTPSELLRGQPR